MVNGSERGNWRKFFDLSSAGESLFLRGFATASVGGTGAEGDSVQADTTGVFQSSVDSRQSAVTGWHCRQSLR